MRRLLASIIVILMFGATSATGQDDNRKVTEAERKESLEVANKFIQELQQKEDFTPIVNELFVRDFLERYLQNEKNYPLIPLEYDVAKIISRTELRNYYIASNNLYYLSAVYYASKFGIGKKSCNKEPSLEQMYPAAVIELFKSNPELSKALMSGSTIDSLELFRNSLPVQEQAGTIIRNELKMLQERDLRRYKRSLKYLEARDDLMRPAITKCANECFGFPAETRLIAVNVPFYQLLLVSLDGRLKIISAVPHRN